MARLKKYKWVRDGDFVTFKTDSGVHTLNEKAVRTALKNLILLPSEESKAIVEEAEKGPISKEDMIECLQWYVDASKLFL